MAEARELLRGVPAFEGLPDDQIDWFLSQAQDLRVKAGDAYARQGDPADAMTVPAGRRIPVARRVQRRNPGRRPQSG